MVTTGEKSYRNWASQSEYFGKIKENLLLIDELYDKISMVKRSIQTLSRQEEGADNGGIKSSMDELESFYNSNRSLLPKIIESTIRMINDYEGMYKDSIVEEDAGYLSKAMVSCKKKMGSIS